MLSIVLLGSAAQQTLALDVGDAVPEPTRIAVCYYNASAYDILLLDQNFDFEVIANRHGSKFFTLQGYRDQIARWNLERERRIEEAERNGTTYIEPVVEIAAPWPVYAAKKRLVVPSRKAECEETVTRSHPAYERVIRDSGEENWRYLPPSWLRYDEPPPKVLHENFGDNWAFVGNHWFAFSVSDWPDHLTDRGNCPVILGTGASIGPTPPRCAQDLLDEAAVEAISIAEDRYFAR